MQNRQRVSSPVRRLIGSPNQNFDLHALLKSTLHTLANLDFEYQHEMQRLEHSRTDPALEKQIAENLQRSHRERRQPYVMLIAELQKHLASGL